MALKTRYSPLQNFSLDNLLTSFGEQPPAKKILAIAAVALVIGLLLFLPMSMLSGKVSSLKKDIANAQKGYTQVVDKIAEYQKVKADTDALETKYSREGAALPTRIENAAKQSNLTVDQVKPKAPTETDFLEINSIEVSLKNVDLKSLTDFLASLENDRTAPMRIRRIQIKPRFSNRQILDVSFEVATFTVKKET
ncbi:MAG TPA: type II secretion system protein GspM [bacterium]|nr:type II secretion system protein GspM [bacterium]